MGSRAQGDSRRAGELARRTVPLPARRGTTLAARWKHRDSFDLDLAVGRDVPLRDLAEPGNPFRQTMGDLGAQRRTTKGSGSSSTTLARSTSSN